MKQDTQLEYEIGKTTVKVFRKDVDQRTGRETVKLIHEGIVLGMNKDRNHVPLMVRVFNPAPIDKGGDISPEFSQLFPVNAANCWCEISGNKKIAVPAPVRF